MGKEQKQEHNKIIIYYSYIMFMEAKRSIEEFRSSMLTNFLFESDMDQSFEIYPDLTVEKVRIRPLQNNQDPC